MSRRNNKDHSETLEEYFKHAYDSGSIDHAIRASVSESGQVRFYIHPSDRSGETLDFMLTGNRLTTVL